MSTQIAAVGLDRDGLLQLWARGHRLFAIARVVSLTPVIVVVLLSETQHGLGVFFEC
jgi:hypothetical protein